MGRLFDEHSVRCVRTLNGTWRFVTDPEAKGEMRSYANTLPHNATEVYVPSMWNNTFGLLEYEGVAWYERGFETAGGCVRIHFGAVMTEAKVYVDGEFVGEHYGGFSAFDVTLNTLSAGHHTLTVRVDNRFDADSIPHAKVDWYHYGGIVRDVTIQELSGIVTDYCHMEYKLSAERDEANVTFRARLFNASSERKSSPLEIKLNGQSLVKTDVSLDAFEEKIFVSESILVSDIHLWDTSDPFLYELSVKTDTDDFLDRVGFREIKVADEKIWLNGRSIEFRGVCRHEEHPEFGFAFPKALMKRDLDIIKDMGCNAVRGSHYPNSRYFVDMMDAAGILFWSEIPIWGCGYKGEDFENEKLVERGLQMIKEMEEQYYNHPCIVIWGMHNEIDSAHEASYKMTARYHKELRENGGNRLITHATHVPLTDICYEFDDIICINQYIGWYGGNMTGWDETVAKAVARRNELGFNDKPIVYSEFGAAAIYGNHTFDCIKWSEEYQAKLFDYCLTLFHKTPEIKGTFIWQFTDIRTCREMGNDRARGFNNKGILNEYRKPKMGYFKVRENYTKFASEEEK